MFLEHMLQKKTCSVVFSYTKWSLQNIAWVRPMKIIESYNQFSVSAASAKNKGN